MQWITDHVVDLLEAPRVREGRTLIVPGDRDAQVWRVSVVRGADPVPLTGETVQAFFQRPDGVTVVVAGSVSGNVVTVTVPRDACLAAGQLRAMLCLGDRVTVQNVQASSIIEAIFMVQPGIGEVLVDPAEEFADITTLSGRVDDAEAAIEANADAIEALEDVIEGEGWKSCGNASGVSLPSGASADMGLKTGHVCSYRLENGNHVYAHIHAAFSWNGTTIQLNGSAIPSDSGLRPASRIVAYGPVTGNAYIGRAYITPEGDFYMEKVERLDGTAISLPYAVSWTDIMLEWFV